MADCRIYCVDVSQSGNGHDHITHVGGVGWHWPVADVVASIKAKTNTFFVLDQYGNRANVGVVEPAGRRPYIRTYRDQTWTDNLLALVSCPV